MAKIALFEKKQFYLGLSRLLILSTIATSRANEIEGYQINLEINGILDESEAIKKPTFFKLFKEIKDNGLYLNAGVKATAYRLKDDVNVKNQILSSIDDTLEKFDKIKKLLLETKEKLEKSI